ncbi:deoxyribose-phosphate aldolase [Enterococcus hulanensis]|uniref:deoxyribose-phosphate aldolase n=1 Tax=Enterococcus hulanensis TaxID=2559929 RepID=UPI00288FA3FE|nr:deoxyribose-phosphate aldolase [Enterococcus hulanensis]MDT2660742.1 deoxyribose-phosphate aldolase [Enterococcus hulanensis]
MKFNEFIDHTLLKANAQEEQIEKLCYEAQVHKFKSVCVNPCWISKCKELLKDSDVLVCTVIGFPLGASTKEVKLFEAKDAIAKGADELDMVINIGALKDKKFECVEEEIKALAEVAHNADKVLKVIIETCLLTDSEKSKVSKLALSAGADFVKTSTGFSTGGATVSDVKLMRKAVDSSIGVKASGGVKSAETAQQMIAAGATRLGTSSGIEIVAGKSAAGGDY